MSEPMIIAIDGPSASGKSTVSRGVARELGCLYVDTGAMYRAFTWKALQDKIDYQSEEVVEGWIRPITLTTHTDGKSVSLQVNGQALDDAWLRTAEVNASVSYLARVPGVRTEAVNVQRDLRKLGSLVAEGRDIGTVVFPGADFKFYVDVPEEIRAARRAAQGMTDSIAQRDQMDSTRKTAPLKMAEDAVLIENIGTAEETIARIMATIRAK
ncbi:MAG: (d)CMP kinase, partial [Verrucomicrobiota bacterium]|nr:(d)CMP kinase [Verrucomicrobiota bacterium]